jgi:hypothetical protein
VLLPKSKITKLGCKKHLQALTHILSTAGDALK